MTKETLELRAKRLGVPFSAETPEADLEAMVNLAESERPLQPIEDLVKSIGGKLPPCYGEMWDGCGSEGCAGCDAERHCRADFFEGLDDLLVKAGLTRSSPPSEIAEALDIHLDSITVALRVAKPSAPVRKRPAIKWVTEERGETKVQTTEEIVAKVEEKAQAQQPAPQPEPEPEVQEAEPETPEPEAEAGPVEETTMAEAQQQEVQEPAQEPAKPAPEKVAKKAKPKAKVAKPKSGKGKKAPLRAKAPAKPAKAKAPAKKARASAKPARAPVRKPTSNGENGADPFARERARSPWVASLKPNQVLTHTNRSGEEVRVKVMGNGYKDLATGKVYPTLYQVVCEKAGVKSFPVRDAKGKAIPGKFREMPNYSAQRYFEGG